MAYSKEQLLSLLQELQISFSKYEHPVVMTVEAQAKYVGHLQGALSKNLFLKDKKQRFYIVSAMTDTKVDLKVLSQRLGLGKGGLRMAPEEALQEILQVPLGSVTPFSLVNESSRHVSLLLDQGFRTQECCFFHPLSNDMTISLNTKDLDKFLKSIGREPSYVDLEANPSVGKDQPPDLAELIPSGTTVLPEPLEKVTPTPAPNKDRVSVDSTSLTNTGKSTKPSGNVQNVKDNKASATRPPSSFADTERFVEEILKRTSSLVMKEVTDEAIKQHGGQLGDVVAETIKKRLSTDLNNLAMIFKNTAYTEGFHANTLDQHRRL